MEPRRRSDGRSSSDDDEVVVDTLATGIELLDRKLHGGLPVGSLTALEAPPASQSELLCYRIAAVRPTLYLTTARAASDVRRVLERLGMAGDELVVVGVEPTASVADVLDLVETLPPGGSLVVDVADRFESLPGAAYPRLLNGLRDRLRQRGGVGFLHCLDGRAVPPGRDLTTHLADVVFRMTCERRGESVESHLTVPKYRGGAALEDVVKLSLTTEVDVDVSRNIV